MIDVAITFFSLGLFVGWCVFHSANCCLIKENEDNT